VNRIFVIGFPRSGTTLLQSLLGAHPSLTTFPESRLLSQAFYCFPRLHLMVRKRQQIPLVEAFLASLSDIDLRGSFTVEEFRRLDRQWFFMGTAVAKQTIALFDAVATARQKEGWLEKSPEHLLFWRQLTTAAPSAHCVHIAKCPIDVVASYCAAARYWKRAPTHPIRVSRRWNHYLRISIDCIGRPRHHFVTYEQLAEAPCAVASRLAADMGLSDIPGFAERYREVAHSVVLPNETHKARTSSDVQVISRTHQYLTPRQISQVERVVHSHLYEHFQKGMS
jgi:Sulfotransferase family